MAKREINCSIIQVLESSTKIQLFLTPKTTILENSIYYRECAIQGS